jgi:magnesium-transporting ATPase (P-type)
MNLAAFLLAITGSLAARVFTTLGLGLVVFTGLSTLLTAINTQITAQYSSIPALTMQLIQLGGGIDAISIILAAYTARVTMIALKSYRPV